MRTSLVICGLSVLAGGLIVFLITERTRRRNRQLYYELNLLADNVEYLVEEVNSAVHTDHSPHIKTDSEEKGDDMGDLSKKIRNMQDHLRSEIECVHRMAYIDALTGVGNTTAYMGNTAKLNRQIDEGSAVFGVAAFDLNGLKQINDHYGHDSGDRSLIGAADVICGVFGKENVFRVGGDEYIAVVPTDSPEEMDRLFEQFEKELAQENAKDELYPIPISVSKGYAVYQKGEDHEYKTVTHRADVMMYRDKDAYYKSRSDLKRR